MPTCHRRVEPAAGVRSEEQHLPQVQSWRLPVLCLIVFLSGLGAFAWLAGGWADAMPSPPAAAFDETGPPPSTRVLAARVRDTYSTLPFLRFRSEVSGGGIPDGAEIRVAMSGSGSTAGELWIEGRLVYTYKAFVPVVGDGGTRLCLEVDHIRGWYRRHIEFGMDGERLLLLHRMVADGVVTGETSCAFGVAPISHVGRYSFWRDHFVADVIDRGACVGTRLVDGETCWIIQSKRFEAAAGSPVLYTELAVGRFSNLVRAYEHQTKGRWQLRWNLQSRSMRRDLETPEHIADEVFRSLPPEAAGFAEVACSRIAGEMACTPVDRAARAVVDRDLGGDSAP